MKYVVFDFDNTLTSNDTFIPFLLFCRRKNIFFFIKYFLFIFLFICHKFKIFSNLKLKKWGVFLFLSRLDFKIVEKRSEKFIEKIHLNKFYYQDYKKYLKKNDTKLIIISASLKIYLEKIFSDSIVIGSELEFDKYNRVKGLKSHCYKEKKVVKLKEMIGTNTVDVFYTDSIADKELVKISKIVFIVKNEDKIKCQSIESFEKILSETKLNFFNKVMKWVNLFKLN